MTEQVLSIPVSEPLYGRLQKAAKAIPVSMENLVVQTLEAIIPSGEDDVLSGMPRQLEPHHEAVVVVFQRMASVAQERMDALMEKNTEGTLTVDEYAELKALVAEYEQIMLNNSEALWHFNQTSTLPRMN